MNDKLLYTTKELFDSYLHGKTYSIPYTADFGFSCSIQCNGNTRGWLDYKNMTITYDPRYAELKLNERGYYVLHIVDEASAGFKI